MYMKTTLSGNDMKERINTYLEKASTEEISVLNTIFDGLEKKQSGNAMTYMGALTDVKSRLIDEKTYEVTIPIHPLILNPLQIVHGGITATLADTAMGSLVAELLPDDKAAVTSEIKMNYVAPGVGKYLRCVATTAHQGRHTYVTEAKVYTDENKLAAIASGSFFVIPKH
jgi:uncharacterized protein (TIGR00369 family)